jgi:hypothetical protein
MRQESVETKAKEAAKSGNSTVVDGNYFKCLGGGFQDYRKVVEVFQSNVVLSENRVFHHCNGFYCPLLDSISSWSGMGRQEDHVFSTWWRTTLKRHPLKEDRRR